jgi:small GTP-binding protein
MSDLAYKIVILGDGGIGKTTLLTVYCHGEYLNQKMTIGVDLFSKKLPNNGGDSKISLQIWDLGGQEQFQFLHGPFLKGASGILLGFDVTRHLSFFHLNKWLDLIKKENSHVPIILLGLKADLAYHPVLNKQKAEEYAYKNNFIGYIEVSSKDSMNIDNPFRILVNKIQENDN